MNFERKKLFALAIVLLSVLATLSPSTVDAKNPSKVETVENLQERISAKSNHALSDLIVDTSPYLYKRCNNLDWCWQPQGFYRNDSKTSTIKYLEVVYGISVVGEKELLFANKMTVNLRPGKSIRMFSGKYNKSFVLNSSDLTASMIGGLLGSEFIEWTYVVRYLVYSDGKSVGKKINN